MKQTKDYKSYLRSKEWADLKIDLIEARGSKCEKCGKQKEPNKIQVHHLTYERIFKEEPQDLMLLCWWCHNKEHGIKYSVKTNFYGETVFKKKKPKNKNKSRSKRKVSKKNKCLIVPKRFK